MQAVVMHWSSYRVYIEQVSIQLCAQSNSASSPQPDGSSSLWAMPYMA